MIKQSIAVVGISLIAANVAYSYEQEALEQEVAGQKASSENIIVYGVRLRQPETEVGSSISILTADEIEALAVDYALDAVATMPGVTVNQNGAFGGSASVRIRGAASEQTLVIVDGVVFNDPTSPGGGFDFARLDPTNIERIEVLKGPQSTLWGTDAIGGVVNIVTKRPEQGFAGRAFAQAGSYDSIRAGVEVGGANDVVDFRAGVSNNTTDGTSKADEDNGNSEVDGHESTTLHGRIGTKLFGEASAELSVLWSDAESEFDSFDFGSQGNVGDGDELSATEELVGNLSLNMPMFAGKFDNTILFGYSDISRDNFTGGMPGFSSEGKRNSYRYQGDVTLNDSNRFAFGAEREENEANGEENSIDGLFALYELQPTDTLTLTAGLRRDNHEIYGGETTGRIAAAFNPTDAVTIRMSWGEGFKAPTLFQTTFFCCGAIAPNSALRPETSDAFDIGVTLRTSDARGELVITYFDQDTTDLIDFSFAIGGYENIAQAESRGIELSANYQILDWLGASLNYAFIDAKDGGGADLVRVPENSGDLRLSFSPLGKLSGNLSLRYNGAELDANGAVPSWTRVDLAGQLLLTESVELYARIENLFDEDYQQILGYGTPDRSGYVGARLRF